MFGVVSLAPSGRYRLSQGVFYPLTRKPFVFRTAYKSPTPLGYPLEPVSDPFRKPGSLRIEAPPSGFNHSALRTLHSATRSYPSGPSTFACWQGLTKNFTRQITRQKAVSKTRQDLHGRG